jgi:hypothetical protein
MKADLKSLGESKIWFPPLCVERPCPKSPLDEWGTEPVAVAIGCFQGDSRLLPQAVPYQIAFPTQILSYEAKPCREDIFALLSKGHFIVFGPLLG